MKKNIDYKFFVKIFITASSVGWSLYIDDSKKIRAYDSELGADYCFTKRFSGFNLGQKIFFWPCTLADSNPKVQWDWNEETGQIISGGNADMCIGFRNLEWKNKRVTILQNCMQGGVPVPTTQWKYVDGRFIALNNQDICMFYKPQDFLKVGACFKDTFGKIELVPETSPMQKKLGGPKENSGQKKKKTLRPGISQLLDLD